MSLLLSLLKDWNFLIPAALWAAKEAHGALRRRGRRVRTLGFRHRRVKVRLYQDQDFTYRGHLAGMVGSVAMARAAQQLRTELERVGLTVTESVPDRFDTADRDSMAVVGMLRGPDCPVAAMLAWLNVPISRDAARIGAVRMEPTLRLTDGTVQVVREPAVVVKARNPNNPRADVFIVAAVTATGVETTVRTLLTAEVRRHLSEREDGAHIIDITHQTGAISVHTAQEDPHTDTD